MHERPRHLWRRQHPTALGLLLISASVLGGCAATATPQPEPAPSPVSSLTQEQQDDRAFEDVFSRYVGMPFDEETDDTLAALLTGNALEDERGDIAGYRDLHQRVEGRNTYYGFEVTSRGDGFMVAKACLDVSGTRIVDDRGSDVTAARRGAVSLQLKAVEGDHGWLISDLVQNDEVRACGG